MLAVVVPAGVVLGALLDLLMFLVARYGPHADSWSFRGNGALAVLALVPAALLLLLLWMITAPALAAVLPRRRVFRPALAALGAGLVALPLAIAVGFLLTEHWVPPGS